MSDAEILQAKLNIALRALKEIAKNKPYVMHDMNKHEVVVYGIENNPSMIARECIDDINLY